MSMVKRIYYITMILILIFLHINLIKCKLVQQVMNITWIYIYSPLRDDKIVDWSKLKQIAEDILKFI